MLELADPRLAHWESFYVIVGSSGGALVGLQFVVIALVADVRRRTSADTINAFATPNVVHFAVALLVSAIMSAPWRSLFPASIVLALCGLFGLVYGAVVIRRARRQRTYAPVWEDWLWYVILPCGAYAALGVAAFFLRPSTETAAVAIGAATLALLLIGIHNAWDAVTHIVVVERQRDDAN